MSEDFKIVTVCNRYPTEPYYCLAEFIRSLCGHKPLVLGTQPGEYTGLGSKPKLLYKAIKDGLIKENNIIFVDCFDLIFQVNPSIAYYEFKEKHYYRSDLIISAEKNCFPADLKEDYDKLNSPTSYKYLNSGFIISTKNALFTCLEAMDLSNVPEDYRKEDGSMCHINDQELWQHLFLKQPVRMALDTQTIFSQPLHMVKLDELDINEDGFIYNKETGNIPFTLHMNGSAKTDGLREPILQQFNKFNA